MLLAAPVLVDAVTSKNVVEYDPKGDLSKSISTKTSPQDTLTQVAYYALYFLGALCVAFIIYGGFLWALAAGAQEKISKAKSMIIYALIGLIIVLSAWSIGYFVYGSILGTV